jgi:hypothetical protein
MTQTNWNLRIGQVAYTRTGRALMKSVALMKEFNGEKLIWKNKPGWENGILVDSRVYDEWFNLVRY